MTGTSATNCVAIVVAAGRGSRAGGPLPKQYQQMGGEPVLRRTLRLFCEHPAVTAVLAVIHSDDSGLFADAAEGLPKILAPVSGGTTRQDSVRAGLEALAGVDAPAVVLVHDAARPYATPDLISRAIAAAGDGRCRDPGACRDRYGEGASMRPGVVAETLDRAVLRAVQTPQAFRYAPLVAAHRAAADSGVTTLTDDASVMEWAGYRVATFAGETGNIKLTTAEDMSRAAATFAELPDVRTGTGFDVHAFGPGDHVMLGGVAVPHGFGLVGHSDADVGLHALTDALLGALCDGDIGAHFPPSDPQWKGASSDRFLTHAVEKVKARGGRIAHLDLTLICEAPKVGPHRDAIRAEIARITGVPVARISVKATTTEKLGFTGRREGIAAMASATHPPAGGRGDLTMDEETYARAVAVLDAFRARGWTLATAESCTGGLVAGALTEVPGSSDVVDRGFVTYSNAAKMAMIGVPEATLAAHGAVSEATARAMAEGALKAAGVDAAVAITGVAGPGGGSAAKPVGLVHFACARRDGNVVPPREAIRRDRPRRGPPAVGSRGPRPAAQRSVLKTKKPPEGGFSVLKGDRPSVLGHDAIAPLRAQGLTEFVGLVAAGEGTDLGAVIDALVAKVRLLDRCLVAAEQVRILGLQRLPRAERIALGPLGSHLHHIGAGRRGRGRRACRRIRRGRRRGTVVTGLGWGSPTGIGFWLGA